MKKKLEGIFPAIVSPCNENGIFDEEKFSFLASSLYKQGVHGLYVCGATGDCYAMSTQDRQHAAKLAIDISRDFGGKVIVQVGGCDESVSLCLAEHAAKIGADAISSLPPANHKHQQLVTYYHAIAKTSGIATLIYYFPLRTHYEATVNELLELLNIKGIIGLKLSDWNVMLEKQLSLALPDTVILHGFDELLCTGLSYGACGGVGLWYNLYPEIFLNIYKAVNRGDITSAMKYQNCFLPLSVAARQYGLVEVFEYIMKKYGLAMRCFRSPSKCLDDKTIKNLEQDAAFKEAEQIITKMNLEDVI